MSDVKFLQNHTPLFKRAKTPTVIQMEIVECGAASLSIILGYYKRFCTLEELRVVLNVSSNGVTAVSIIEGAKTYGLDGKGYKKSIESLTQLKPPFIVYWNMNHFLVVEGFSKKGVYINDPGSGPKIVSFEEFCQCYTGIVITLTPNEQFSKGGNPPSVIKALRNRIKGVIEALVFLGVVQACQLVPKFAMIAFTQIFIDEIFLGGRHEWKWYLLTAIAVTTFISTFLTWIRAKCIYFMNAKISIKLSSEFFFHVLKLPLNFYQQRTAGDLAYRLELNDTVVNIITEQLAKVALNLCLIVFFGFLLFSYSFWLGLIGLIDALMNVGLLAWINRKRTDASGKMLQQRLKMIGYSVTGLKSIETIKSLGIESLFFSSWSQHNSNWLNSSQGFGAINTSLQMITPLINILINTAFIGVGAVLVIEGQLTIGQLMALRLVSNQFVDPLKEFVLMAKTLQQTKIDLLRLDDTLNNKIDPRFMNPPKKSYSDSDLIQPLGNIIFDKVTFGFSKAENPIINNCSFEIKKGEIVALLGPADAGKSTLSLLAAQLYEPWEGSILIDNKKRENFPNLVLRNAIMLVDQGFNFFMGTIKDNLTFWNDQILDEYLIEACKDACIHDEIMLRAGGYSYEMMEMGIDFSQGERIRLEIARALISRPSFLIIDEAFNLLDLNKQKKIIMNIKRRDCSCLIITNRISTISLCNKIMVMEDGTISQNGTHGELKDQEGYYRKNFIKVGGGV